MKNKQAIPFPSPVPTTEDVVNWALSDPQRFIKKNELDAAIQNCHMMMGVLQQQIAAMDIALGLILESMPRNFEFKDVKGDTTGKQMLHITPGTPDQFAAFKVEHKHRVDAMAEKAKAQVAKQNKTKVTLD